MYVKHMSLLSVGPFNFREEEHMPVSSQTSETVFVTKVYNAVYLKRVLIAVIVFYLIIGKPAANWVSHFHRPIEEKSEPNVRTQKSSLDTDKK